MEQAEIMEAIREYQCSGCMNANEDCYKKSNIGDGCDAHYPGTIMFPIGSIFLGMPKGFNRCGPRKLENDGKTYHTPINIFESSESFERSFKGYNRLNAIAWYLKKDGRVFVRGMCPRINATFLHVHLYPAEIPDIFSHLTIEGIEMD